MKIAVKVYKVDRDKLKAYASVTLGDCFAITGIKIVEGKKGLFVSMPSQKNSKGEYKDVCFPVTKEFRQELIDAILNEYAVEDDENLPF